LMRMLMKRKLAKAFGPGQLSWVELPESNQAHKTA